VNGFEHQTEGHLKWTKCNAGIMTWITEIESQAKEDLKLRNIEWGGGGVHCMMFICMSLDMFNFPAG
jgi:hypothetical protein